MVQTLVAAAVAPLLTAATTVAARRWGARLGGIVSAFPAIVGPVLFILALQHGRGFAARAAAGTLLGLAGLAAFALAYGWAAAAGRSWPASLGLAWAAAAATSTLAGAVAGDGSSARGLVVAVASLVLAERILARGRAAAAAPGSAAPGSAAPGSTAPGSSAPGFTRPGPTAPGSAMAGNPAETPIPIRMALTAALVLGLSAAAGALGPVTGGLLAALPVLASILAVLSHRDDGPAAAAELLRGMLAGMAGFVAFCEIVAVLEPHLATGVTFVAATGAALLLHLVAAHPAAASAARSAG